MPKRFKQEIIFVLVFSLLFISIRSLYFKESLNFSTDQAATSSVAWDIWHSKKLTLIGPRFTLEYHGRYMFMGPAIYYMQLLFLILGNFEPIQSSFIFMVFAGISLIPLYLGTKILIGQKAAFFMVITYCLLPYFVDYTKFLWNPTFQLSLLPYLVLAMGLFKKYPTLKTFFIVSLVSGLILQFHYTFFLIIFISGIYYFGIKKLNWKYFLVFLLGIAAANCWLFIFEIRNHFYFLDTLRLFITHFSEVSGDSVSANSSSPHYYLTAVFFGFLLISIFVQKRINYLAIFGYGLILVLVSLLIYSKAPSGGFRMAQNWSYLDELKAHQIIVQNQVINYNLANLIYDPKAEVQKYLLKKDRISYNDNYLSDDYLFILSPLKDYLDDPAFEIKNLQPAKEINKWRINSDYNLYLAHREPRI